MDRLLVGECHARWFLSAKALPNRKPCTLNFQVAVVQVHSFFCCYAVAVSPALRAHLLIAARWSYKAAASTILLQTRLRASPPSCRILAADTLGTYPPCMATFQPTGCPSCSAASPAASQKTEPRTRRLSELHKKCSHDSSLGVQCLHIMMPWMCGSWQVRRHAVVL